MEPLVSVIVPIYKVEAYLERCLESILAQTYRNLEIILVDDGSPDNCGKICDRYAGQDSRIRVIYQENAGVSAARNAGLDVMTGEYLVFVDPDDWLTADAVEILYARMVKEGSDLVIGQAKKIWDDGTIRDTYCGWLYDMNISGAEALAMLGTERDIPCYLFAKLYKASIFSSIRFPNLCCAEDVWILLYILPACCQISIMGQTIYYYFQRATSIVHSAGDRQIYDSIVAAWNVARVLMERQLWYNAARYYHSGLHQSRKMRDAKQIIALHRKSFSINEQWKLGRNNWKNCAYLLRLYFTALMNGIGPKMRGNG